MEKAAKCCGIRTKYGCLGFWSTTFVAAHPPLRWSFGDIEKAFPIPALGANVFWNLLTNSTLAVTLAIAAVR